MKKIVIVVLFTLGLAASVSADQIEEKKVEAPEQHKPSLVETKEMARYKALNSIQQAIGNQEATQKFVRGPMGTNKDAQTAFIILQNQRIIELLDQLAKKQ
jgi:hypothetical protein